MYAVPKPGYDPETMRAVALAYRRERQAGRPTTKVSLRTITCILWATLLWLSPAGAVEDRYNTQHLYKSCISRDPTESLVCMSYLAGVADTMANVATFSRALAESEPSSEGAAMTKKFEDGAGICAPKNYTGGLLKQIFVNWALKHPTNWTDHRLIGAMESLHDAFPCPPK